MGTSPAGLAVVARPSIIAVLRPLSVRLVSLRSHFERTWISAISRMPLLIAWISSPSPGADTTIVVCDARATSCGFSKPRQSESVFRVIRPGCSRVRTHTTVLQVSPLSIATDRVLRIGRDDDVNADPWRPPSCLWTDIRIGTHRSGSRSSPRLAGMNSSEPPIQSWASARTPNESVRSSNRTTFSVPIGLQHEI